MPVNLKQAVPKTLVKSQVHSATTKETHYPNLQCVSHQPNFGAFSNILVKWNSIPEELLKGHHLNTGFRPVLQSSIIFEMRIAHRIMGRRPNFSFYNYADLVWPIQGTRDLNSDFV